MQALTRALFVVVALATGTALADRAPASHAAPQREKPSTGAGAREDMDLVDLGDTGRPTRVLVPPPPTAAPEIAALGKQRAGTWHCKGTAVQPDGSSSPVMTTLTTRVALDGGWIQTTGTATTQGRPVDFTSYDTYDAIAKQWTIVLMTSAGGHVIATSLGEAKGEWLWNGTLTSPGSTLGTRQHETWSKGSVTTWTEVQIGGAWRKVTETTCAR